jgi:hypothetical protein
VDVILGPVAVVQFWSMGNLVFLASVLRVKLRAMKLQQLKDFLKERIWHRFKPASQHMVALNAVSAHPVSSWLLKPYSIQIQNPPEKKFLVQLTEICADVLDINKLSIQ